MKRKYKITTVVLLLLIVVVVLYITLDSEIKAKITGKPKVVTGYLCSDLCNDSDIKKYYEGVTDLEECKNIGGEPYAYTGWGEFYACLAD